MRLAFAQQAAQEVISLLTPYCSRIEVVGSVRREALEPKDIEILCDPFPSEWTDLESTLRKFPFSLRLDSRGRPCNGPRAKRLLFAATSAGQVPLDLFIRHDPAQYGVLQAIRTGPKEFSQKLVTPRRLGGSLPNGWVVKDGQLFDSSGSSRLVPDEETLFDLIGIPYIKPHRRFVYQEDNR